MKILIIILIILAATLPAIDLTQDLKEARIKIDLPNDSWALADRSENKGMVIYSYKRKPVDDRDGRHIIPNMAVIIEDVDKKMDAVTYSALKRSQVKFDVSEVFTHEKGPIKFENAIGYKGTYTDSGGLEHTVYVVHAINERKGIQFICDATTDVLAQVEDEFRRALKSIRK